MKKTIFLLAMAFALHTTAKAQQLDEDRPLSFGFGFEGGVVTGDFKPAHKIGAGVGFRVSYLLGNGFATFSTGGILLFPRKGDGSLDPHVGLWAPFKAGYKLIIADEFFVMGEAGYSILRYYYEDAYGLAKTTQGGFVYAPTIGIQLGLLEVGLRYQAATIKGAKLQMGLLRLGYNF